MADKVCIKKGCNYTRTHGYFCQKHRVIERLVDPGPRCAAIGCFAERKSLTLFCGDHQRAMDRGNGYYASDKPIEPFRAPLPDRKQTARRDKLVIKWRSDQKRYEATCHLTNVVGRGATPGEALRAWKTWWEIPY